MTTSGDKRGRKATGRPRKEYTMLPVGKMTEQERDLVYAAWPDPDKRRDAILAAAQAAQETRDEQLQPDH